MSVVADGMLRSATRPSRSPQRWTPPSSGHHEPRREGREGERGRDERKHLGAINCAGTWAAGSAGRRGDRWCAGRGQGVGSGRGVRPAVAAATRVQQESCGWELTSAAGAATNCARGAVVATSRRSEPPPRRDAGLAGARRRRRRRENHPVLSRRSRFDQLTSSELRVCPRSSATLGSLQGLGAAELVASSSPSGAAAAPRTSSLRCVLTHPPGRRQDTVDGLLPRAAHHARSGLQLKLAVAIGVAGTPRNLTQALRCRASSSSAPR